MTNLKKWGSNYLKISPIFNNEIMNQPGQEKLMAINSRLFAMYCLNMMKRKEYNKQKITQIIKTHFGDKDNINLKYIQTFNKDTFQFQCENTQDLQNKDKIHFKEFLYKMKNRSIKAIQFLQYMKIFQKLIQLDEITDLDVCALDVFVYEIYQISAICNIKMESSMEAIGTYCQNLIESHLQHFTNHQIFDIISINSRINKRMPHLTLMCNFYLKFQNFESFLDLKNGQRQMVRRNIMPFLCWIIHLDQLGQFVYKNVKKNYQYWQFVSKSLSLVLQLLKIVEITEQIPQFDLIILLEILAVLEMEHKSKFYDQTKKNIQIQIRIKKMKEIIKERLDFYKFLFKIDLDLFFKQISKYEILFKVEHSKKFIRYALIYKLQSPHFFITYSAAQLLSMMKLAKKVQLEQQSFKIFRKWYEKMQYSMQIQPKLVEILQKINNKDKKVFRKDRDRFVWIENIYELKRIKDLLKIISHKDILQSILLTESQKETVLNLEQSFKTNQNLDKQPKMKFNTLFRYFRL